MKPGKKGFAQKYANELQPITARFHDTSIL